MIPRFGRYCFCCVDAGALSENNAEADADPGPTVAPSIDVEDNDDIVLDVVSDSDSDGSEGGIFGKKSKQRDSDVSTCAGSLAVGSAAAGLAGSRGWCPHLRWYSRPSLAAHMHSIHKNVCQSGHAEDAPCMRRTPTTWGRQGDTNGGTLICDVPNRFWPCNVAIPGM